MKSLNQWSERSGACTVERIPPPGPESGPARILVVDDSWENRELLQEHLEAAGYGVRLAEDGEAALTAVAAEPPDLILLDLLMPGIDGYEVCHRLKREDRTAFIPIVVITALQESSHRLRAAELGADEFLTRPISELELLARVRSHLRRRRSRDNVIAANCRLEGMVAERTRALEEAHRRLQELDRLKSEFLGTISHELLTPLTPLKGYVQLLLQGVSGHLTPNQRESLLIMERSIERLHRQINDLLQLTHLESGGGTVAKEVIPVPHLVKRALATVEKAARERRVALRSQVDAAVPAIPGDAEALGHALRHLLENAVKFTDPGGRVMLAVRRVARPLGHGAPAEQAAEARPTGVGSQAGEWVEFAVTDTGVGMGAGLLPRIFEPFWQADSSTRRRYGGMGLGLALVKRIVDGHGGRIAVASSPGRGSIFTMQLPLGDRGSSR